ncbi:MAG: hypothetical protein OHK93_003711 [Ramalina farinacea]|uniref:Hexosyltransferase n=1 Tax=Ramalina farinacea TaxID=258253 RepID=A0AA43U1H8_9LECA|nr:hypothetical protein [Ramalina farinacea]
MVQSRQSYALVPIICFVLIILIFSSYRAYNSLSSSHHGEAPQKSAIEAPSWLVWTSSAAHLRQRREIIRSTWQTLYRKAEFKPYFVIGTPSVEWLPVIKQENETYGDMIMIEGHADDKEFATTLKPFETFKLFRDRAIATGKKWDFVSKIDDDSFLNAGAFRREFLLPDMNRTIISRVIQYGRPHVFPGGQFYTLTWDLVEILTALYETTSRDLVHDMDEQRKLKKRHEDFMIADLMLEAGEQFEYVELTDQRAFDVITMGNVTEQSINVHRMKTDEQYLWVAAMFDETGYKGTVRHGIDYEAKLRQSIQP